jgi:hypothetical protein
VYRSRGDDKQKKSVYGTLPSAISLAASRFRATPGATINGLLQITANTSANKITTRARLTSEYFALLSSGIFAAAWSAVINGSDPWIFVGGKNS